MQLWEAFSHAGWVGKSVLAILFLFSVISWAVMFAVWQRFRHSQRASRRFLALFRKAKRLADVQAGLAPLAHAALVGLFRAGYAEIEAQIAHGDHGRQTVKSLDSVER